MLAVSRSLFASLRGFTFTSIFVGIGVLAACSSNDDKPGAKTETKCDSSKCEAGKKCLALNGEEKCRKPCSALSECPFNSTCTDTLVEGVEPFCVADTAVNADGTPIVKKEGQWGALCQANKGLQNPDCDGDQGFLCYGISPTDGDAYCTRYDCEKDSDCAAGFWCGKINQKPNVLTAKRGDPGQVQNVCLRRTYCSTCKVDLDCPTMNGLPQHCVDDVNGTERFCAPECEKNANCPNEAKCAPLGDVKVCYPRAGVCVGDGSLCSPCRVDTDCGDDGACVKGQYTSEKSCAKKSTTSCGTKDSPTQGSCPKELTSGSNAQVRCLGTILDEVPPDYCHGIYIIGGTGGDVGCWTPKR